MVSKLIITQPQIKLLFLTNKDNLIKQQWAIIAGLSLIDLTT